MSIEAMKLALEALETECDIYREHDEDGAPEYILEAMTALKERLAQPEQEPVVYVKPALDTLKHSDHCRYWNDGEFCTCGAIEYEELQFWKNKALAQHTEQEPVIDKSAAIRIATALGWTPPEQPKKSKEN